MKTRVILVLVAAVAAAAEPAEPRYRGKPLSVWLEQLRSERTKDRQEAAFALQENIGPQGKAAVPALIEALKDKDKVVHSRAANALGKIGPAAKAAAPALIAVLKDRDMDFLTRSEAAGSLGKIGAEAKTVVPALAEASADKDVLVRLNAVRALEDIGPKARDAIPALRKAMHKYKDDLFLGYATVSALVRMGEPGLSALTDIVENGGDVVGEAAAKALGKLGPEARRAVPSLIEVLGKDDEKVRQRACQVLGKIGPEARGALPALRKAVKSKSSLVHESAAWAFVRIDSEAAKREGIQAPAAHYYAWIDASGDDFDKDDNASAGGGKIGGTLALWVNGRRADEYSGGGTVLNLDKRLRPGRNEVTLSGRHEKPVYVKVTKASGGGFEGVVAKRKFPGPGGKDKAEPLTFEAEEAMKP